MMIARSIRTLGLAVALLLAAGPFAAADSSDAAALRMAEAVPGFGGLFYDEKGDVNVYLLDASLAGELRARPEMRSQKGAVRILEGRYDFRDLHRWRSEMKSVLAQPGVVLIDIDERRNRIVVGVDEKQSGDAAALVERELGASGAPPDAVIVEPTKPFKRVATLSDRFRPVRGGLQIAFSSFLCTLGFNANISSVRGFVTNSHCTDQQGGVTGTLYFQSTVEALNRFALEVLDPLYFVGGQCPSGRACRFSDSSFARYEAGPEQDLGKIARPQSVGSLTVSTVAPFFQIVGTANFPATGQTLNKVGRTTGWTRGVVTSTCVDVNVGQSNITLLCQDIVAAGSAGGDSGSPVFAAGTANGDTSATLYGILWGGNGPSFAMSSFANIQSELGPLTTVQDPVCDISISPTTATHGAGAGTGTVEVTAPGGCAWTAASQASWISFPSGDSGSGDGTLSYAVEANTSSVSRTGTLTIGGQTFTVTQSGVSCTYSISPTSATVAPQGETGGVSVTAPLGCAWTASSQEGWITVVSGASGSGDGTVGYSVASNPAGQERTGTIVIAGRAFTIVQGAVPCTYAISPSSASVAFAGGSFSVQVTAPPGCAWTATSHADWMSIVSGPGNGVGSVSYAVAANPGPQRAGTLVVAGQTFTVTQAANPCPSSIAPATATFTSAGGTGTFSLTTPAGCVWEATSNVPWIIPTLGRFGSGSATVGYSVQLNPGGAREGRIAVGGSSLRITQDPNPLLRSVDRPQDFQTLTQPFDVSGWAIDRRATSGTGVDTIHNWAFPAAGGQPIFVGVSAYGGARPDVGALFGAQFTNSGFGVFVRGLPPGQYQIHVFPHSSVTGAFENPQVRTITAQANPGGHVDTPAANATVPRTFVVAGWAFDRAAASGSGIDAIHIWAYPGGSDSGAAAVFLGATTTTVDRPDVVAAYQDPQIVRCGYGTVVTVPAPGLYDVVVFARSALTGQFSPYVRRVTAQ